MRVCDLEQALITLTIISHVQYYSLCFVPPNLFPPSGFHLCLSASAGFNLTSHCGDWLTSEWALYWMQGKQIAVWRVSPSCLMRAGMKYITLCFCASLSACDKPKTRFGPLPGQSQSPWCTKDGLKNTVVCVCLCICVCVCARRCNEGETVLKTVDLHAVLSL